MVHPLKQHANYEDDFHAWADEQARLLCSRLAYQADFEKHRRGVGGLGPIGAQGAAIEPQAHCPSHVEDDPSAGSGHQSWRNTIFRERLRVEEALADMPSLNQKLPEIFAKAYAEGRRLAIQETGKNPDLFATAPELTLQQVRDDGFLPFSVTWDFGSMGPETQAALARPLVILPRVDDEED